MLLLTQPIATQTSDGSILDLNVEKTDVHIPPKAVYYADQLSTTNYVGCKWLISLSQNGKAQTLEVFATFLTVSGDAKYTIYGKVGDSMDVDVSVDIIESRGTLVVTNNENYQLRIVLVRIPL